MQTAQKREVKEPENNDMTIEVLDKDLLPLEDTLIQIENEIGSKKEKFELDKKLEYFSENIIIYSFLYKKKRIFETIKRTEKKRVYSYVGDESMHKSHLLNLINRGDTIVGHK